jgi:hypothetical protein
LEAPTDAQRKAFRDWTGHELPEPAAEPATEPSADENHDQAGDAGSDTRDG